MPIGWRVIEPPVEATIQAKTKKLGFSAQGQQPAMGPMYALLKKRAASFNGRVDPAGGIATTTKKTRMSAIGSQTHLGGMSVSVKKLGFQASSPASGTMSAGVKKTVATMVGNQPFTGTIGASLKKAIATLTGAHTQVGAMSGALKKSTATAVGKTNTISYVAPFADVPTGLFDVKSPAGAGSTSLNGTNLLEGASSSSNSTYYTVGVLPDTFDSMKFSVEVSPAVSFSTDRGYGAGCSNDDGSKVVYFVICGQGGVNASIFTIISGTRTSRATFNVQAGGDSDLVKLVPTVDGSGVVTWTVYKNGVATGLTWTDSTHIIDLPGKHPAFAFKHIYSGGQFYGPGIDSLVAVEL